MAGWMGKTRRTDSTRQKRQRLQLKLCYAGELGSGIATARGKENSRAGFAALSQQQRPRQQEAVTREGSLRNWLGATSTVAQAHANSRTLPHAKQRKKPLAPSKVVNPEQREIKRGLELGEDSLRSDTVSELDLQSEKSEQGSALGRCSSDLPRMPVVPFVGSPLARQPESLGVFGFGELPLSPPVRSVARQRKRKRVIETSSPAPMQDDYILAPPSTPSLVAARAPMNATFSLSPVAASPQKTPSVDVREIRCTAKVRRPSHKLSSQSATETDSVFQNRRKVKQDENQRKRRSGTRIAWDTQDESEAKRLNRTSSASSVEAALLGRNRYRPATPQVLRPPRCPPSVHFSQDKTDYMDLFRDEDDSPVQYTLPERQMGELRERHGLSPIVGGRKELERRRDDANRKARRARGRKGKDCNQQVKNASSCNVAISELPLSVHHHGEAPGSEVTSTPFDESATECTDLAQQSPRPSIDQFCDETLHGVLGTPKSRPFDAVEPSVNSCYLDVDSSLLRVSWSGTPCVLAPDSEAYIDDPTHQTEQSQGILEASPLPYQSKPYACLLGEFSPAQPVSSGADTLSQGSREEITIPSSQRVHDDLEDVKLVSKSANECNMACFASNKPCQMVALPSQLSKQSETLCTDFTEDTVQDSQDDIDARREDAKRFIGLGLDNSEASMLRNANAASVTAKKVSSRIIAPDTQDVLALDTQEIHAGVTQSYLCPQRADDTDEDCAFLPISPVSGYFASNPDKNDVFTSKKELSPIRNVKVSTPPDSATAAPSASHRRTRKSSCTVTDSISAAWFDDVLRGVPSTQINVMRQTYLAQFFTKRPGGVAEEMANDKDAGELALLTIVRQQSKCRRKGLSTPSWSTAHERTDDGNTFREHEFNDSVIPQVIRGRPVAASLGKEEKGKREISPILQNQKAINVNHISQDSQIQASDSEEDDIDADVSISSCEGWVEGKCEQVPSPLRERNRRKRRTSLSSV